jgi:hypothetical protein
MLFLSKVGSVGFVVQWLDFHLQIYACVNFKRTEGHVNETVLACRRNLCNFRSCNSTVSGLISVAGCVRSSCRTSECVCTRGVGALQCLTSQREYAICQGWVVGLLEQLLAGSCTRYWEGWTTVCMNILSRKCSAVHCGYRRFDTKQDFCFIPDKLGNLVIGPCGRCCRDCYQLRLKFEVLEAASMITILIWNVSRVVRQKYTVVSKEVT